MDRRETESGAKRRTLKKLGFCAVSAALILLVCSMNSPLYAYQIHDDVHCFISVARGILHGMLPYRDLLEQKGPLTYLLYALVLWLIPGKFIGIWLMEWVCVSVSMLIVNEILRLYMPRINIGWSALLFAVACSSRMFKHGGMVEELCWPFMLVSLYAGLRSLHNGEALSLFEYALHGLLAGCVSAIKVNLLGVHFAFMAVLAIHTATKGRSLSRAIKMCACFLLGMLLAWLPILIWLGANGALDDMWRVYIVDNAVKYQIKQCPLVRRVFRNLHFNINENYGYTALLAVGNLALLGVPRRWVRGWEKALWLLAEAVCVFFIYMGGRSFAYYYLAMAPFGALALLCLKPFENRIRGGRAVSILLSCALVVASVGCTLGVNVNRKRMFVAREKYPQAVFAEYIHQTPGADLLNYGFLDGGFYYAADIVPKCSYFCSLNVNKEASHDVQERYLRDARPEYVVTCDDLAKHSKYAGDYKLIAAYMRDTPMKELLAQRSCFLYKRKPNPMG